MRRIGKFKASRPFIFSDGARKAMSGFVVVDVRWNYDGVAEYTALSPIFEEIEEGAEVPSYDLVFSQAACGCINTTATRL